MLAKSNCICGWEKKFAEQIRAAASTDLTPVFIIAILILQSISSTERLKIFIPMGYFGLYPANLH